jgi:signal transduction histidine kinase
VDNAVSQSTLSEARFSRFVLGCVSLGFLALIGAVGITAWSIEQTRTHTQWVEHTYQVEGNIAQFRVLIERAEVQRRGFLLNQKPVFRTSLARTLTELGPALATLRRATADNPAQQRRIARIEQIERVHKGLLTDSIVLATRDPAAAQAMFDRDGSVDFTRAVRRYCDAMVIEEHRLLARRTQNQQASAAIVAGGLVACAILLGLVAILSVAVIMRYTRALVASRNSLARARDTLEDHVAERTVDLSRANEEIQRFAYIVSHDLRSPLVNVMGFTGELEAASRSLATLVDTAEAEAPHLLTEDAKLAAREDLPEAIGFIRTSTQKMDRLINAILRLSREGKRVLTPEPVDLVALVEGIVASLQHRLDALGAEVAVRAPMPALRADRLAVEQMLSNLIENAVKYLKPGRPGRIVVSGRSADGRVSIDVADNGRGIDPRDHDRVFDLFRRSGQQDQPGEGIGLAHVRALAYRLGGLVDCRSTLGDGATFTLSLPAEPAVAKDKP